MTDRIKALEDALRKLELANDRVCGARPQRVYNLMIAGGMADALRELDCARAEARAALAASQPAQPVAVKVKPLVWEQSEYPGAVAATAKAFYDAGYKITSWSGFDYVEVTVAAPGYQKTGYVGEGIYPDFDAAKAAAQADYEARIMAALDVLPITVQDAARVLLSDPDAVAKLARAYDREDSAQRGEADPHDGRLFPTDPEWEGERIACATAALRSIAEGRA